MVVITDIEQNKAVMRLLLKNNDCLCGLFFTPEGKLYPQERETLLKIANFFIKKNQQFLPTLKVNDILLCGGITSYIYNDKTDVDLGIVVEMPDFFPNESEFYQLLKKMNPCYQVRGFNFRILNRRIDYGLVPPSFFYGGSGTYSLTQDCWLNSPRHREFSFTLDEFYKRYCVYNAQVHQFVDLLERIDDAFLTMESCHKLDSYLYHLRMEALKIKSKHPEQEYCLEYNMYRCLKKFGVVRHFYNFIMDSCQHNVNILEQKYG